MAIVDVNDAVQGSAVRNSLLARETDGPAFYAMPNFSWLFTALEAVVYSFLGLATLCAVPLVGWAARGWVARLFVVNFAVSVASLVGAGSPRASARHWGKDH